MSSIKINKALVLADQAIYSGGSFLLTLLLARYLPVHHFGTYSAIVLVVYLGISMVSAFTIQVFQVSSNTSQAYLTFVFLFQVLLCSIIVFTCKVYSLFFSYYFSNATLIFGLGFVTYDFCRKILLAIDKPKAIFIIDTITVVLTTIAFILFSFQGLTQVSVLMYYFFPSYFIAILISIYVIKPFQFKRELFCNFITSHFQKGKWLFFTAIIQWWSSNLFVVASGIYLGPAALGALRLGQSLFGVLNVLLQTFENYVLPQSASRMKLSQQMGIAYLKKMNQYLTYIFIPVLIVIFYCAVPILSFAGGYSYIQYAFVLKGLCILYVFILASQPLRFFLRANQINNHFFYAYLLSFVFAALSSHWLILSYGLHGVITGLIVSQIILLTYWLIIIQIKNIKIWKSSTLF